MLLAISDAVAPAARRPRMRRSSETEGSLASIFAMRD
jgi:hypothetical protein